MLDDLRGLALPACGWPRRRAAGAGTDGRGALVWLGPPGVTLHDQADAQARALAAAVGAQSDADARRAGDGGGADALAAGCRAATTADAGGAGRRTGSGEKHAQPRHGRGRDPQPARHAALRAAAGPWSACACRKPIARRSRVRLSSLIANWPATEPISDARLAERWRGAAWASHAGRWRNIARRWRVRQGTGRPAPPSAGQMRASVSVRIGPAAALPAPAALPNRKGRRAGPFLRSSLHQRDAVCRWRTASLRLPARGGRRAASGV